MIVKNTGCFCRGPEFSSQNLIRQFTDAFDSSSRGSNTLLWPSQAPGIDIHVGKIPKIRLKT